MDSDLHNHPSASQVLKPTRMPYINFVQAFRQNYQGPYKKPTEMVRLAAATWRTLTDEDKAPFVALAETEKSKPGPSRRVYKTKRLQRKRLTPSLVSSHSSHRSDNVDSDSS